MQGIFVLLDVTETYGDYIRIIGSLKYGGTNSLPYIELGKLGLD